MLFLRLRLTEAGGNVEGAPFYTTDGMPEAKAKVATAAKENGIAWGLPVGTIDDVKSLYDMGAQLVNYGGDFGFVMAGFKTHSQDLDDLTEGTA